MDPIASNKQNGFPSDMLPMKKKNSKDWNLQYSKAFHAQHQKVVNSEQFTRFKELAEGKQPIDQYKKILGSRKRAGKPDMAWRNLDYEILPIIPKFIKILKNKILAEPKEFKIRAIDPYSVDQQRKKKNAIIAYMTNVDVNQQAQRMGVPVQSPFEQGEPVPNNLKEVDLYLSAFPKNKHVSEMYDELDLAFNVNKWKQTERDIVDNLVKQGVLGTWPYVDSKGYIRIKPMKIERVITNPVENNDFSDMTRIGEYVPMTIGQIRVMAKDEIAKGEITEKNLADIASKAGNKSYVPVGRDILYGARSYGSGYVIPYDNEKVSVLRWQAKSTDTLAYVLNNDNGNITLEPRDNPFWLDKEGYSDEEYSQFQKKNGLDKKVVRTELENIYQGWWVCDSDIIFNYGLKTDIQRNLNSLAEAEFDAKIYTTDFDSVVRQLEPVAHSAQTNWLQFLHHSAKSIPDGIAINKRALTEITIGGKGGTVLDALDLVDQYVQGGTFIYNDVGKDGREIKLPFELLKGSGNEKAMHHLQMVFQSIDLIRAILGLNEVTDASTPNPELGKGVSELAVSNSNTALGDLHYAYNYIYEETARSVVRLVPYARKKKNPGYIEALGSESQNYWEQNSDKDFLDFSTTLDVGWDEDKHNSMRAAATASLKTAGGSLLPQDVYIIENEKNPEKAYMILEAKTKERNKEAEEVALRAQQANAQVQQQSALVAEQAKQQTIQLEHQLEMERAKMEIDRISHEMQWKALLIKLDKGLEFNNDEQERFNQLLMSQNKNKTSIATTAIMAHSRQKA